MTTRPTWLHPQLYQKVCELQQLCNRLQYTGTIIVDPNNVTIIQDDSHTCTIPADHARNITIFVDPMAAIKDDLLMPSTWDQYCGIIEVQLLNQLGITK
ncbi:hypothetical protein C2G38_2182061 [Gigaspora rosea]|uniref:Uncharacterized protein n=1 Tax=Gigaspora rosea TaxID=44941 RepID=A0A397VEJ2_9GLOM|nr:hypothetical protein C2G38_2182061 [Gigaspora rosea]